ncbi:MAG: GGDEF domain-containing protein, partial [Oscillospiraceae bacterium]|nr:GGDEF domain-containing protein [Oscillospiraceae bacterium]
KYTAYEYQHNVIYNLISAKSLDAAVCSAGTLGSFVTKEEFKGFLDSYEGLPIITTENKVRGYPCVRMLGTGIKDLVTHLVQHHGKKYIAFVSGPRGNADADERLQCYMDALEENGLEYDPELVAYGKFSEYCVDIVGELLDKNEGRIDAVCFANDMMCKGGYKAIERRGLRVGEDIAVTGYDDSEVAVSLKPPLTTVRADAARLGSRAVREAVKLALGEKIEEDISLGSAPVYRLSCGCARQTENSYSAEVEAFFEKGAGADGAAAAADCILSEYIPNYANFIAKSEKLVGLRDFAARIFTFASDSSLPLNEDGESFAKSIFMRIIDGELIENIPPEDLSGIVKKIRSAAEAICRKLFTDNSTESVLRRRFINSVTSMCSEILNERIISLYYSTVDDMIFTHFLISNITKDMTVYGSDESKCFFSIVNNLYRVHMDSSYIYTYESPLIHTAKTEWEVPEIVNLQAYHDGDKLAAVTGEARKIHIYDILCNEYTPKDRRRTMIISPLFVNEEQYGVIVCELENEYFPYIYSITPQICTAIKLTNLVAQLEESLDVAQTRNNLLNRISMSDELTGIYNRRGFYAGANRILKAPENEGRRSVLIFGDLDNLKTINDTFGHDDGDYAIVTAANYLKSGLRADDVVARIGGDEFAAYAICDDTEIMHSLPARIKKIAAAHNEKSDKPYNVTISIGICEIVCSPELNIQQFMDKADAALYSDKKNKNRNILKEPKN